MAVNLLVIFLEPFVYSFASSLPVFIYYLYFNFIISGWFWVFWPCLRQLQPPSQLVLQLQIIREAEIWLSWAPCPLGDGENTLLWDHRLLLILYCSKSHLGLFTDPVAPASNPYPLLWSGRNACNEPLSLFYNFFGFLFTLISFSIRCEF